MCVSLQYNEDMNKQTNKKNGQFIMPPVLTLFSFRRPLSVECILFYLGVLFLFFLSHFVIFHWTLILLNLPFQQAQSKDSFPHLCIVFKDLDVHFYDISLGVFFQMVNGYITYTC